MPLTTTLHISTSEVLMEFIDANKTEILEIWDKAQRGERITKINR